MKTPSNGLFWKFCILLWSAQVITTLGVVAAVRMSEPQPGGAPSQPVLTAAIESRSQTSRPSPGNSADSGRIPAKSSVATDSRSHPALPLLVGGLLSLSLAVLLARYFTVSVHAFRRREFASMDRRKSRAGKALGHGYGPSSDHDDCPDAERLRIQVERQGRLLHDAPHELRSSLVKLRAALHLMRQQPNRREELVARSEKYWQRMDRLVDELLTLTRLDAGITGNLSLSIDLNDLISSIAEAIRIDAETKGCRVVVSVPDILVMQGNPDLVRRAIENVVRNALNHTAEESTIAISVKVDGEPPHVYIDVSDAGNCLPDGDLKKIFEPFFRSAGSNAFGGCGMGLTIARSVVEAHGGRVNAENRAERGLCVRMELPLAGS